MDQKLSALNAKIAGAPEGFDVFYGAPTIILVLADKNVGNPVEDGSLCLGNMLMQPMHWAWVLDGLTVSEHLKQNWEKNC